MADGGLDARTPDGAIPGNPEAGPGTPDGAIVDNVRRSRIVSMAPSFVVVGSAYRYRVKSSSKTSSLELDNAPSGMAARGGYVEWTPSAEQAGSHRMTLRAVAGQSVAAQELNLKVATSTLRAAGDVDADEGGSVYSDSPQNARMLGAGVYVPPRSVSAGARMTVSELDQAPVTPNAAGRASAVRFGPEGQVFEAPARISLPLPEAVTSASSRTNVFVYQPMSGRWQRVQTLAFDPVNRLVTARASHFSVYAAIQSALDLDVELSQADPDSACAGGLLARAWVSSPLDAVELASLNNLPEELRAKVAGEAPSVQDLLGTPGFTGSLRAVQVFELVERVGDSEVVRDTSVVATTLYVAPDGSATVTHSDALGNALGSVSYAQPALALDDIAARLRGSATAASFDAPPSFSLGLGARLHLLFFADDASAEPVNADDLGIAAVERAPLFDISSAPAIDDGDCDGVVDGYDTSDDRLVAGIEASPRAVVNLLAGDTVKLAAKVVNGTPVSETWQVIDGDGAGLTGDLGMNGVRSFTASAADRYLVSYRAVVDGKPLEHVFAIDVSEAPADNTPPSCRPVRELDVGRVGDALALTAIASDLETPSSSLRLEWGLLDASSDMLIPSPAITPRADKALFSALDAGNFQIGCRAYDGKVWGPVGRVKLSVVPRSQNRAPGDLTLSPGAGVIKVGDTLSLHASAKDPDGDQLLFTWYIDGNPAVGDTRGSESTLAFKPTKDGAFKIAVEVMDYESKVSAASRVLVGALPVTSVDADKDGWNAGIGSLADCNDADPNVHPGAVDVCGDAIDSDCDGVAKADDCDGDNWLSANGDCNDNDAKVYPQASELCDGVDNDCNQQVDENFSVGKACSVGVGACVSQGTLACASDQLSAQCTAVPLKPGQEVCDGIDNDCDRVVDEDVCPVDASVPDASILDASVPDTSVGTTVDATAGGCVTGPELCDQVDNDCDGKIDNVDPKPCDTGLPGACGPGAYGCNANGLSCIQQTVGRSEVCNQVDDDCNGKVDDGITCMCSPAAGEICGDGLDNDCDGAIDDKDSDCKQSCLPGGTESCFDGVDNDCDGAIDDKDADCCSYQGPEVCNDGKDNDCNFYIDGQDPACQQGVSADSCKAPGVIQLGTWMTSYFNGAASDIVSSCYDRGVDLVYGFTVKDAGDYQLSIDAAQPFAWSVQSGSCDVNKQSLSELWCSESNTAVYLRPGSYFLVLEGDKGAFSVMLDRVIITK